MVREFSLAGMLINSLRMMLHRLEKQRLDPLTVLEAHIRDMQRLHKFHLQKARLAAARKEQEKEKEP